MRVYDSLNHATIELCRDILMEGVKRETRGYTCLEFPVPQTICITNPTNRYITIPERKWNKILPFAESIWLALGMNNLDLLPGHYVKNLYNFSDDGKHWRAGYGPRIRGFVGSNIDYEVSKPFGKTKWATMGYTDQLQYVINILRKDPHTRQAGITIHDPVKDSFNEIGGLKETKDQPCTRLIHFQQNVDGALDCHVFMRSNDILWGFSAVNTFNFAFMQEYVANILELPIGNYYVTANNLHVYTDKLQQIEEIANAEDKVMYHSPFVHQYFGSNSLKMFDANLEVLYNYIKTLQNGMNYRIEIEDDMLNDVALVFYHYHTKREVKFKNMYLNKLFEL